MNTAVPAAEPQDRTAPVPRIEVRDLCVRFGRHEVLRELNLQVRPGETLAIVGESGCGKTVLLKTLMGLVRPYRGEVRFDGVELFGLGERELIRQRIRVGFLFQGAALFDSLSVLDNVAFPLRQHTARPEADIRAEVVRRLSEVNLSATILDRKPVELSGGMRKRVGLARALVLSPEVILYDEPTAGLDPIMSDVINELILQTRRRYAVTSVIVTHDLKTVAKVADRVVMLAPLGRLADGESQILFNGTYQQMQQSRDPRVMAFVRGDAALVSAEIAANQAGSAGSD